MIGMEKMIAGMIGITPDEMKAIAEQVTTGLLETATAVQRIEAKQDLILEALKNGHGSNSDSNRNGFGGTGSDSSRVGTLIDGRTGAVIE